MLLFLFFAVTRLSSFFKLEIDRFVVTHYFDVMCRIGKQLRIDKEGFIFHQKCRKQTTNFRHGNILNFKSRLFPLKEKRYRCGRILLLGRIVVQIGNVSFCDQVQQYRCDEGEESGKPANGHYHRHSAYFAGLFEQNRLRNDAAYAGGQREHLYRPYLWRETPVVHSVAQIVVLGVFGRLLSTGGWRCFRT